MKLALILVAVALACGQGSQAAPRTVTHEDIKDAILSFAHKFRDLTDKLERHELRERQLGDQLKKALSTIDRRERAQDGMLANTSAMITQLLEIVNKIKTNADSDERDKDSYQMGMVPLQSWMTNMEEIIRQKQPDERYIEKNQLDQLSQSVNAKLDSMASAIERLESKLSESYANNEIDKLTDRMEQQLTTQKDWKEEVQSALEDHRAIMSQLEQNSLKEMETKITQEVNALKEVIGAGALAEKTTAIENELKEMNESMGKVYGAVLSISEGNEINNGFHDVINKMFDSLTSEVKSLAKVESVLVQTSDNVMDTKKRIEYGVQQILQEVGDTIKLQSKELNQTMNIRFDAISNKILENIDGGHKNLSSKIETELSQVWRQIGIMHQQLIASAGAIDKLQQQTETYVTGTNQTMENVEVNVSSLRARMEDMADNINYLLGRLSLVTQEFDQIKSALTTALEKIRSNINTVQNKIDQDGPGPNPIDPSTNYEPDQ